MGNRLYVGNLSFEATADAIRQCFSEFGDVTDVRVITDRETGRSRGFAFVTMSTAADANTAREKLQGVMLEGRPLRVSEAEERGGGGGGGGGAGGRGGGDVFDGERNSRGGHRGW